VEKAERKHNNLVRKRTFDFRSCGNVTLHGGRNGSLRTRGKNHTTLSKGPGSADKNILQKKRGVQHRKIAGGRSRSKTNAGADTSTRGKKKLLEANWKRTRPENQGRLYANYAGKRIPSQRKPGQKPEVGNEKKITLPHGHVKKT